MPVPFITTPLIAGPISGNSYNFTITGLVPSTIYEYRSYMIVGGNEIYGTPIYQIATAPPPISAATVTTTILSSITQTGATGGGNVTANGGSPVTARGIAWNLGGSPTIADAHTVNGAGNGAFSSAITGLAANTTYFVRAYATNAAGTSYGNQRTFITLPLTPVDVCLFRTFSAGINTATGCICANPSLVAGQCFGMTINLDQTVCTAGNAITELFCKPAGNPSYSVIQSLTTSGLQHCGHVSNMWTMCCGDAFCYQQSNTGNAGSWSTVVLHHIDFSCPNICACVDLAHHCDCIHT